MGERRLHRLQGGRQVRAQVRAKLRRAVGPRAGVEGLAGMLGVARELIGWESLTFRWFSFTFCSVMSGPAHALCEIDDTDSLDAWERALLDRQLETLDRLAELGLAVAAAVKDRVTAPEAADTVVQHAALDFARVSRAVRMTLALQSRLVRDFKTPVPSLSPAARAEPPARRVQVAWIGEAERIEKRRVCTAVRRRAEDAALDAETTERLVREAEERLERDDVDDDLMTRPFDELVALICEDLGLDHLPREAAGGGPSAVEPMVEGAGRGHSHATQFDRQPRPRPAQDDDPAGGHALDPIEGAHRGAADLPPPASDRDVHPGLLLPVGPPGRRS
jgi:hypothetical protein